jgi:regulator of RNase E activity RraA
VATSTIGFRTFVNTPRPSEDLIAPFRDAPAGNVCDAMDRLGAMDYRLKPLDPASRLCGPALTVRTRPGDNLMVWKAVDVARPGDVLVAKEARMQADLDAGVLLPQWVNPLLEEKGCETIDFAARS